ncbi:MAG: DUF2284 domain-containing protein [Bacillota bacterium]
MDQNEKLNASLNAYVRLALDLGISDAKVIRASDVLIDERVRLKCSYPRCANFGACGNCPPFAPPLDFIRGCMERFRYGIFLMQRFDSEDYLKKPAADGVPIKALSTQKLMHEAVCRIESAAFRDGYELALGFANGSCKKLYCSEVECSAIKPGGKCRFPLKSRGSMEGCGMWAMRMARNVGWDIIPAGSTSTPEKVPHLMALGLVMID